MLYFFRAAGRTLSHESSMLTRKDLKISTLEFLAAILISGGGGSGVTSERGDVPGSRQGEQGYLGCDEDVAPLT